jgi:uncharacterized protein (TIGR02246 family)
MSRTILRVLFALLLAPLPVARAATPPPSSEATRTAVQAFVKAYVDAVNKADVSTVMEMYSRSPEVASVADGEIQRGWDAIRTENDQMVGKEGSYKISIGSIDVIPLGGSHAAAVAPYTVTVATDQGTVQVPGALTLVLGKSGGKWLILHDHMSIKAQEPAAGGE